MSMDKEILKAVYTAIESRLHLIGSVIDGQARREILKQNIIDKGDFYGNTGNEVIFSDSEISLVVGSNVPHEQYVLGGKEPSWTPLQPLVEWVERKGLSWLDAKGNQLSVKQIAYMIRSKIKREGIPERNVYAEIIKNKEEWIYKQLDSIEIKI